MSKVVKPIIKAAAVAAAVAAIVYTGGAALGLGFATAGTATFVTFASFVTTAALISGASALVGGLLAPKPPSLAEQVRGQLISTRSPTDPARVIYGKTRVGGTQVFVETTGAKNETMFIVTVAAGHQINQYTRTFINDEVYNGSTYKGSSSAITFGYLNGSDTQAASSLLSGTTAASYQFRGLACFVTRLIYNENVFPQGIPNVTVEVEGKLVFDPRTSTTAYSNNAALCIRDYLLDTRYGLGVTVAELDETSFIDAANICDENINLRGGGTEKRYTVNGAFSTNVAPKEIIEKMLTACAGKLSYAGGRWTLRVGAYRQPVLDIDENMIVGGIQVQAKQSKRDIFNGIKGLFSDPNVLYQPTSFPLVTSQLYRQEDGEAITRDVEFSFTTSSAACQRLAKIELEQARQQIAVGMACNMKAFSVQPGDVVRLSLDRYGWENKLFEVYSWEFSVSDLETGPTPTVNLLLRETAPEIYDWNEGNETLIDYAPNTNLPDPFNVNAPGLSVTDTLVVVAEEVLTALLVRVSGTNTFQDSCEVQAKLSTDTDWINLGRASGDLFELVNVIDGEFYDVRARTINTFGVKSAWSETTHEVVGKTAPPSNVENFSLNIVNTEAHLTWDAVPDLDLSHYKIRHSRLTTGANYAEAVDLLTKISRPATSAVAPAMTGTYFIKALDKLGNASRDAAETVAIIDDIKNLNAVEVLEEDPDFSGQKQNVVAVDGSLVLDSVVEFDDIEGLFDDQIGNFDGAGGSVAPEGTYWFSDIVDLGSIYTSRVTAFVEISRVDYVNTFDSAQGLFDDFEGDFDGDPNQFDDTNAELYVSTTENDPSADPTWSEYRKFFVGDYTARALRFKVLMFSNDGNATPSINKLSVTVDMPDRIASGSDIASGTDPSGKIVVFDKAFFAPPAIGIAAQNLSQGDYFTITSKSSTSFTIKFMNSSGTTVNRTFDYLAKGYGELAA